MNQHLQTILNFIQQAKHLYVEKNKAYGQGTGLGLLLSYDIVKEHNGELKVETKESEGSTFSIQLPTTN